MALGDVVKRWRAEMGWNKQEDLVRRSGGRLSQANVSDIERNKYPNPTQSTLEGLAEAFGVPIDALVAAAKLPVDQIPSIVGVLPPEVAGLPDWARDFLRWGGQISPMQRQTILDLVRQLADQALAAEAGEVPADPPGEPAGE